MITMTRKRMKMTVGVDAGANPNRMTADAGGQGSLRGDAGARRRMTADAAGPNPKGVGAAGVRSLGGDAGARRRMTADAAEGAAGVGGESGRLSHA